MASKYTKSDIKGMHVAALKYSKQEFLKGIIMKRLSDCFDN